MATPRAVALLLILVASLPAQEPPRDGIFGEVKDRDGKVFAGATVTLLHVAHPSLVDAKYVDRVTATTDERGRFHAQLLHGMPYVAWATGPVADGAFACSSVATDVVAGVPLLQQATEQRALRRVRPRVDAAWKDELQFVASARFERYMVREPLALVDGVVTLPPFPTPSIALHALRGEFTVFTVELAAMAATDVAVADGGIQDVKIGAPAVYSVRLLDERDNPVAGALLTPSEDPRRDGRGVRFGRSHDDGVVRVQVADRDDLLCMIVVTGENIAANAFEGRNFVAAGAGEPGVVRILRGTPIKGSVHLRANEPAAAMPLLLDSPAAMAARGAPESSWADGARVLVTGADGSFAFRAHRLEPSNPFWFAAALSPAQRARLCRSAAEPPLAATALLLPQTSAVAHDLRVDALDIVDVKVLDARGSAPGLVHIVVVPMRRVTAEGEMLPTFPLRASTDRAGRVRFLAPKGTELAMWAITRTAAAWMRTSVDGRTKNLRLDPRHVFPMRATDGDGKPLADMFVYLTLTESPHLSKDAARVLPFVHGIVQDVPWLRGNTDADGCLDLIVPLLDCGLDIEGRLGEQGLGEPLGWFRGPPAERTTFKTRPR